AVDDLDGAVDASTEATGVGEFDMHESLDARSFRGKFNEGADSAPALRSPDGIRVGIFTLSRISSGYQSERFDFNNFHIEAQRLAGQRVVEVDGHLAVVKGFDYT